jgi:hypothetical protein
VQVDREIERANFVEKIVNVKVEYNQEIETKYEVLVERVVEVPVEREIFVPKKTTSMQPHISMNHYEKDINVEAHV